VIIVDDKLSLEALAGRLGTNDVVATTWAFHFRLLRALEDQTRLGRLTRGSTAQLPRAAAEPPEAILQVLDPRVITAEAADLAARQGLNLIAAELVASAVHYGATVHLSRPNVGRRWPEVMAAEGVTLRIV